MEQFYCASSIGIKGVVRYKFYYVPNKFRKAVRFSLQSHEIMHGVEVPSGVIELDINDMENWIPSTSINYKKSLRSLIKKVDFIRMIYTKNGM